MQASTSNLEDYYCSLGMTARIEYVNTFSVPRIAQLTQKTNQFNLTTRRYSEADIRAMAAAPECIVLSLALRDRYSDNGIVGVLILRQRTKNNGSLILSCSVGRSKSFLILTSCANPNKTKESSEKIVRVRSLTRLTTRSPEFQFRASSSFGPLKTGYLLYQDFPAVRRQPAAVVDGWILRRPQAPHFREDYRELWMESGHTAVIIRPAISRDR